MVSIDKLALGYEDSACSWESAGELAAKHSPFVFPTFHFQFTQTRQAGNKLPS